MEKLVRVGTYLIGLFIVLTLVQTVTNQKFNTLREKNGYTSQDVMTIKVRERQLDCMAMNIYREAGHEPFEGKVAVAQVTLNRAASGQFPNDICKVVYQKNVVYDKVLCQFSWYCEQATISRPKNKAAYKESEIVARQVLLENFRLPSLTQALYFHGTHINPGWKREKVAVIGGHVFYK